MARELRKEPCTATGCSSSDGKAIYDDGTGYCFKCETYFPANNQTPEPQNFAIKDLGFGTMQSRQVTVKVAEFFGVRREVTSEGVASKVFYPYYQDEKLVGYKVRTIPKDFKVQGTLPTTLFGQQAFPAGGKRIVITEGEEDALAIAQSYASHGSGVIYPVVSIPSATNIKAVVEQREYLRSFDEVILFVDTDDAGRAAADKLANAIGYDKVKTAKTKFKDASEAFLELGHMDVLRAIWDAQPYNPQGILTGEDLWDALIKYNEIESVPYPNCFEGINKKISGMRQGEITLWVSGTGAGKSTMLREIALDLVERTDDKIGIVALKSLLRKLFVSWPVWLFIRTLRLTIFLLRILGTGLTGLLTVYSFLTIVEVWKMGLYPHWNIWLLVVVSTYLSITLLYSCLKALKD